jgi:hypothetical protein
MSKAQISMSRKENRDIYKVPGHNDYEKRPINALYFRPSEGTRHAMAKALAGYMLNTYGEIFMDDSRIRLALKTLSIAVDEVKKERSIKRGSAWFISEAQERTKAFGHKPGETANPVRDIVCLDDGTQHEFETEKARAKRHEKPVEVWMV